MTRVAVAAGRPLALARSRLDVLLPLPYPNGLSTPESATATADATPHAKGAWVELIASAPEADGVELFVMSSTAVTTAINGVLLDVGFGAALSEVVKVANVLIGGRSGAATSLQPFGMFPLTVPKGTRIAIRVQSTTTLQTATIGIRFLRSATRRPAPSSLVTLGANEATSSGVSLAAGANNVKGSYVEIASAAPMAFRGFVIAVDNKDATTATVVAAVDVAIGAAASEVNLVSDVQAIAGVSAAEVVLSPQTGWFPVAIPAGARISARYSAATASGLANIGLAIIGVPA